jgi:hypothetical protein
VDEQFFDDLSKALTNGTVSRRRALQLVGAAALGAALMPVLPKQAEALTAKARRRCRKKGGVVLEKGNCHCGYTCTSPVAKSEFQCTDDPNCFCYETLDGRGTCAQIVVFAPCASNAGCPTDQVCVVGRGCGSQRSCTTTDDCITSEIEVCVNGRCVESSCATPCQR